MSVTVLSVGRLDGLMISPAFDDGGKIVSLLLTVDTIPGIRMVLDAAAAAELRDALTILLNQVPPCR